jgi:hypothetical protein
MHYSRWWDHGDPLKQPATPEARPWANVDKAGFWAEVDKNGPCGCWLWRAGRSDGYGQLNVDGYYVMAHRIAYELLVGPIPRRGRVGHMCGARHCVNPDHLELLGGRRSETGW